MEYTRKFEQLSKSDAGIAGGKGASLGEMTQAGIPVPPGFVVLASTFDAFLEAHGVKAQISEILGQGDHTENEDVERASAEIQKLIYSLDIPKEIEAEIEAGFAELNAKYVAVRSSATAEDSSDASWAGELESYLNVTVDSLLDSVRKCWASLFTPRAIFYRFEKKLHLEEVSVAVVVQKMIQSEVSGITFTVHPITKNTNQMVIEAGYGLGEAIVGGKITPDNYVIKKDASEIADKYISDQSMMIVRTDSAATEERPVPSEARKAQKLEDPQILKLAQICMTVEKHYGFPCDIEWAMEDGKISIVQSRPITTL